MYLLMDMLNPHVPRWPCPYQIGDRPRIPSPSAGGWTPSEKGWPVTGHVFSLLTKTQVIFWQSGLVEAALPDLGTIEDLSPSSSPHGGFPQGWGCRWVMEGCARQEKVPRGGPAKSQLSGKAPACS